MNICIINGSKVPYFHRWHQIKQSAECVECIFRSDVYVGNHALKNNLHTPLEHHKITLERWIVPVWIKFDVDDNRADNSNNARDRFEIMCANGIKMLMLCGSEFLPDIFWKTIDVSSSALI